MRVPAYPGLDGNGGFRVAPIAPHLDADPFPRASEHVGAGVAAVLGKPRDRSAAAMSWRCGELRATRCAEFLSLPGKSGARSGQQSRFSSGSSHGHTFPHRVGSDRAPRSDSSPAGHRLSASNNQRPKTTATSAPISGHQAARDEGPCHPSQAG